MNTVLEKTLMIGAAALALSACGDADNSAPSADAPPAETATVSGADDAAMDGADKPAAPAEKSVAARIADRDYPSVFQAWNPLDMPDAYPLDTLDQRIETAAKHDLLWEEPVSQLGFGTDLVLGLVWEGDHGGMATAFTEDSLAQALENRRKLLELNPNMVMLLEVRWRDAPGSFLPEDSEMWLRNDDGTRVLGWDNGPEPYYMLNYENEAFQDNVARQSRLAVESGVYDGVMLDWSGYLPVVQKTREALGPDPIIIVNIHDDIEDGVKFKDYINGAFMECAPDPGIRSEPLCSWDRMKEALDYYETELLEPHVNALENWGDRGDLQSMRAVTTLGLATSNAYVLYADPNPLPTPDHLHDWYDFWDVDLGKPVAEGIQLDNGAWRRDYDNGVVIYNPKGNGAVSVSLGATHVRASSGEAGESFDVAERDGDIFLKR